MRECTVHGCKQAASVTVDRDEKGKPYCRPHGLAEARRLPISDVSPIADELSLSGLIGHCFTCRSAVWWVKLDEDRVALSYGRINRPPQVGDALLRLDTGTAKVIVEGDDLEQVAGWIKAGRVTLHRLHAVNCIGHEGPVSASTGKAA